MKKILLLLTVISFGTNINAQDRFSLGLTGSPDLNFYKYSAETYWDDTRTNRSTLGISAGLIINYCINDNIDLYSNMVYSSKKYSPDRSFHFGILRSVEMDVIDIPLNVKFNFMEFKNRKNKLFISGGLTYQVEITKQADFDFSPGFGEEYNFIKNKNYIFPNIGIGFEKDWNKVNAIRAQLNYRLFKCHCEYLNPWADKLALEFSYLRTLPNKSQTP